MFPGTVPRCGARSLVARLLGLGPDLSSLEAAPLVDFGRRRKTFPSQTEKHEKIPEQYVLYCT